MRLLWPWNKYYFDAEIWIRNKLFDFELWRAHIHLTLSCKLWRLRGLKSCDLHGFQAQSWITGKCKKCEDYNKLIQLYFAQSSLDRTIEVLS